MRASALAAEQTYDSTRTILVASASVALLIALGAALWISLSISKSLNRANTVVRNVAEGDLTQTAEITSRSALDVPRMLLIGGLGALVALGVAWVVVRSRKVPTPAADADSTASADSTDAR